MLNTPTDRPSTETTRCVPSGKSATRPTTVTIDPEQRQRVLTENLAPKVFTQWHLVELDRVVDAALAEMDVPAPEVARTVVFLASEAPDFMTGAIVDVNGASYLRS